MVKISQRHCILKFLVQLFGLLFCTINALVRKNKFFDIFFLYDGWFICIHNLLCFYLQISKKIHEILLRYKIYLYLKRCLIFYFYFYQKKRLGPNLIDPDRQNQLKNDDRL